MVFRDPFECAAAQEALDQGNALEAARILLNCQQPDHRCVRVLRRRVAPILVEQAAKAHADGEIDVAAELIECAALCAELDGDAKVLQNKIGCDHEELQKHRQWQQQRLERAEAWAEAGRLRSALGLIQSLDGGDAARARTDLQERLERFDRYVAEFADALQQDDHDRAATVLDQAREIGPAHPEVLSMEKALRKARPQPEPASTAAFVPSRPPQPTSQKRGPRRTENFAISGLSLYEQVLVIAEPVITIGKYNGDFVHLPLQAHVYTRHALMFRERDRKRRELRYRLVPYLDCEVLVNGVLVGDSQALRDGDVIQFGNEQCRWKFILPVPGSATAVLEREQTAAARVRTPDGTQFQAVVLADDELRIVPPQSATNRPIGHLVEPNLPARDVVISWQADRPRLTTDGGELDLRDPETDADLDDVEIPCKLGVHNREAEMTKAMMGLVGQDVAHGAMSIWFDVFDPFRRN